MRCLGGCDRSTGATWRMGVQSSSMEEVLLGADDRLERGGDLQLPLLRDHVVQVGVAPGWRRAWPRPQPTGGSGPRSAAGFCSRLRHLPAPQASVLELGAQLLFDQLVSFGVKRVAGFLGL